MAQDTLIVIDHIQGPLRGSRQILTGALHGIGTGEDAFVHFPAHRVSGIHARHAALARDGDAYRILAVDGAQVFVNGEPETDRLLAHGDLIRLGETGPLLRYRIVERAASRRARRKSGGVYKSMKDVFDDCMEGARSETSSAIKRGLVVVKNLPKEITRQASPLARAVSFVMFLVVVGFLSLITIRLYSLESRLDEQADDMASTLGLVEKDNRVTVEELRRMRDDLVTTTGRLSALENDSGDAAEFIRAAMRSVVFIQASYGFSDPDGRMLRAALGPNGQPIRDARGSMMPTFGGEGPVLERQYTGTAFVASTDGLLLSNHHVAEPWLYDESAKSAISRGFKPVVLRMLGFLPGEKEPFDVSFVDASASADVALLRCSGVTSDIQALELSTTGAKLGQDVFVLGYPTGIRALLARADPVFVDSLLRVRPEPDFWQMVRKLADTGHVAPLITRGIVGQITPSAVVYDAETTHGGSGGPVIGLDGRVVAVNAAIVGDFGGSNLGVPAEAARELVLRQTMPTDR